MNQQVLNTKLKQKPQEDELSLSTAGGIVSDPTLSNSEKIKPLGSTNSVMDINHSIAYSFRPGRLSSQEMLERLFPTQSSAIRALVLHGCSGDVIKAIEHFLSIQET